jgi:predicted cobalt transporter CbtA
MVIIIMDSLSFLVVSLISGAIAGTILGVVNLVLVEPYLDKAIGIEVQNAIESGEKVNPEEHTNYRFWQKGGEVAAGTILGMALGSLLGIVFAFGRKIIPSGSNLKKALVFSGIIWLVIFMVPAIKYPSNPPTVGDPDTINYRQSLFVSFILISGFTALGLAILYTKIKQSKTSIKFLTVSIIYAIVMICAFVVVPPNPDEITAPLDLVNGFRIMSMITMTIFWIVLGITFGLIWNKLKPHETTQFKTI